MDIFVGSLPFKLKEQELKELFEKFGEVTSVKIVIDKITRQNKGFGFVEMPDEKQAINAIETLNGTELEGRTIIVSKSQPKTDSGRNKSGGRDNRGRDQRGGFNKKRDDRKGPGRKDW